MTYVKGETRLLAPHKLQHIGDQVPLCKPEVPTVVERECGPTRDPPRPVSIDMGPHICNGGGPDAADDTEEEPHRLGVYGTDAPRDDSVASERKHRIVVQIHGHDYALGHSSQLKLQAVAERAQRYQAQLGVKVKVLCAVGFLAEKLRALTQQISRAEAEESALRDANNYDLPNNIVRRDAKHMCELGSF